MQKKVFISYSWGNKKHQDWVVNLGTRLMNDTIDVILDRWSLKDGHDIHSFMEEMVKSEDIFRVLIISDAKYKEKADGRQGGVGTETQIITPSIYSNQKQEKFIPIVLERDEHGNPYLPIFLSNRKYIDLSKEENFEDSYEELLRNILETPAIPKPKLGTNVPLYITENVVDLSETNSKLRVLENQLKKTDKPNPKYTSEFIDAFLEKLWEFKLDSISNNLKIYGEKLIESLKSFKPLKEDFIKFIDILSSGDTKAEADSIIEFFEVAPKFERPKDERVSSWNGAEFEIFKIIFQELFLYTIAICLKNKNYNIIADLFYSRYYIKDSYSRDDQPKTYTFLYNHHRNLESYMSGEYNKITGFGEYVITNLSRSVSKEDLITADTLCYFVSYLNNDNIYDRWFPTTYLYNQRNKLPFFEKITSKKHFERIKGIFGVENEKELKDLLLKEKEAKGEKISYGGRSFTYIPFIYELVNPDNIAVYR